ncbi:glycerophosphodiester phosphodiesterase [Sphingomonas sp. SUN039]|uniref:glycerophosphodiester phosphodiesterase n=1 Tax=Sphingomonas sp. SUN039 TaxID=2937787 RepID=UPI0021640DD5|nr:glycerophosphodiester phosphodiesterase [Sphingomonas sp. SUN039]UVO55902.1 glycerophosphodiester phosphodiesterase [Sphingomonas sp. SUN039]
MIAAAALSTAHPLVIAHRGASGERPEHTLASYTLAIEQGADFIEPDLVMTRDHVLVARHENEISGTTDVAAHPEFAARKATKVIDGQSFTGWFTEDFTLAELKTLRARERLPDLRPQNRAYDGQFEVPTFDEILALVKATKRRVGVYPEIKHGTYFDGLGMNMEAPLLAALKKAGFSKRTDPVFIQSFEVGNLQRLRKATKLRLVQLIDGSGHPADRPDLPSATMVTPTGLAEVARYADAIGVTKTLVVPRDGAGHSVKPLTLVADAHKAGLKVHVWTFRAENFFLPLELRAGREPEGHGDLAAELRQFYALGVDGVFSDYPGIAVTSRR